VGGCGRAPRFQLGTARGRGPGAHAAASRLLLALISRPPPPRRGGEQREPHLLYL
jgi:hypothetical protein